MARPIVRSFEDEFGSEDIYDGKHEEWVTPFWDPHTHSPFVSHSYPAPAVAPTVVLPPLQQEPAIRSAPDGKAIKPISIPKPAPVEEEQKLAPIAESFGLDVILKDRP